MELNSIYIPPEILIMIFNKCDQYSIINLKDVCKYWRVLCYNFINVPLTQVYFAYWKWDEQKVHYIIQKYFPKNTTPKWVLKASIDFNDHCRKKYKNYNKISTTKRL